MPTERLAGQVAWISGGASGIGAAVAELFATEGARVAVADIQHERGEALVRQIARAGGQALFTPCDVAHGPEVQASIEQTAEQFGGLQIVANCAAVVHVAPLDQYQEDEWDRLLAVNVKSIFLAVKYAMPLLRKNSRSYVVNIGSISSFVGQGLTPAYSASKGAVLQLSRSIALDYAADGLRSNCICPGITDTPMLRFHLSKTPDPEATLRARLARVPMGVAIQPSDIAKAALYLACEDSSGITGTSLVIDGGYLATAEWNTTQTRFMET
ncbi:MAG TPA: SDR family NAD(P)-dependent oxidoreductase [Pirellulales bacterium]|jgi:NAD(P)-dependent dehydrogenase (short-subunit alcohol dehydrogenase family)|nr:SDR family NAD(P)-dependent oxidoreductase [Pirellulales bacterium]